MRSPRALLRLVFVALVVSLLFGVGEASAAGLSPDSFGVNSLITTINGQLGPTDLPVSSAHGVGVIRLQIDQGINADPLVAFAANAHLRVAPVLGLPQQLTASNAAAAMAQYVDAFARRYGPNGSFWSQNPQLPYLPIEMFEIGNEPNIPLQWIADGTNLHWTDPSSYAQVYEAARAALHQVDPSGRAVVGGLADSGQFGVDLQHDEEWLAALTPQTVDGVGFHPYTFPVSFAEMNSDTEALRQWMDANGMHSAFIDINEVGACDITVQTTLNNGPGCLPSIPSGNWGTFAAGFADWALCSRALNVTSFQPEYWGDMPSTDQNAILALVSSTGTLTPYGQDYLNEAQSLTSNGCPLSSTSDPTITGAPVVGQSLRASSGGWAGSPAVVSYQWERCDTTGHCTYIPGATSSSYQLQSSDAGSGMLALVTANNASGSASAWSAATGLVTRPSGGGGGSPLAHASSASMFLQLSRLHVSRRVLTVTVHVLPGAGRVVVVAIKRGHRVRLTLKRRKNAVLTFSAKLSAGHWRVTVTGTPSAGYAASAPLRRLVTIR